MQKDLVQEDQENEPLRYMKNQQLVMEDVFFEKEKMIKERLKVKWVVLEFFWHQLMVRTCFPKLQVFSLLSDWSHYCFQHLIEAWV